MVATGTARGQTGTSVEASGAASAAVVEATGRGKRKLRPAKPAAPGTETEPPRRRASRARRDGSVSRRAPGRRASPPRPLEEDEVRRYLPLVRQVVQRMLPRKPVEVPMEDLVSWGVVGLLDAMRKYDCRREAAFPTYAQYRIRGSILDYLRRCDWLPRSARQKSHDLEEATLRLERRLGRSAAADEIAAELKMSLDEYAQTLALVGAAPMIAAVDVGHGRGEETFPAGELLPEGGDNGPMRRVLRKQRVEILAHAIEQLPDKERIVVSFYYFEGLTMREMAEALHLTEGRISQLHSQAMQRLREILAAEENELTAD